MSDTFGDDTGGGHTALTSTTTRVKRTDDAYDDLSDDAVLGLDDDLDPETAGGAPFRAPWSLNATFIAISVIAALIFGIYSGVFQRAYGTPEPDDTWQAIGAVLFMGWVIGVTIWAGLRVSTWISGIVLRTTARVSVAAYAVLRVPLRIATLLTVIGLAAYGAVMLWSRVSVG